MLLLESRTFQLFKYYNQKDQNMNKDNHNSLSLGDRFKLFLSLPAIDREFSKVKRPAVNIENLPSSIYFQ